MKNFIKNKENGTNGQLHHNPRTRGLATHYQSKTDYLIKSKYRHTNRQEQ